MRQLLDILIRIYQLTISPLLGDCCRFYPSCSNYCREAIHKHGCFKGLTLGIMRLGKCHPFHPGGVDHVP
ncbi:MAG: membrane protein insertion efficiency factor YidD [Verrucomicrobia bacterium]|nr:membrane protein insertion efficiency factor YidD [Verrucomicrobiota bacterium]MBU1733731.1 membrane protein insertion efficiency factor YidD [Verrucomicrobiota bacterium]MBU1855428.1 membrane protein insertion efficiency factor YidD [Verrucomicrobiota bacterium]